MTQPRGKQIKSVSTRYSVIQYTVSPGDSEFTIPASSFPYAPGGADRDVPARVRGTITGPFLVLGGDTLSVRVDGAPAVNVVLSATDTTAGRVALKVNAAVGATVASNDEGHLVIRSVNSGAEASLVLADVVPGTVTKLGLTPGTFAGTAALTDGLLTVTPDGLGGEAPIATGDGRNLVTDGGGLVYVDNISGGGRLLVQLLPGGTPVVATLTQQGSNIRCVYQARLIGRTRVMTLGSTFSLLDGTTPLTLTVNGQGFTTTFPSGPYSRDGVLDRINGAYATARGVTDPWARIDGTVPAPFLGLNGSIFLIEVDGGAAQEVYFAASETTLTEVINKINADVTGVTAFAVSGAAGQYLGIRSNNTNGRTSSLKIYAGGEPAGPVNSNRALERLGVRAGFYRGCFVADQYGPDEIEIFSAYRGYFGGSPEITISGSGTTMTYTGLTAGTYAGQTALSLEPVDAPYMTANHGLELDYIGLLSYPVVLEFGDVPGDNERVVQQFLAKSAGSNVEEKNQEIWDRHNGVFEGPAASRGFFDVGKPLVMPSGGSFATGGAASGGGGPDGLVKQITRISSSEIVEAVVGSIFETPGNGSNSLPVNPIMRLYADPTDSDTERGFRFYVDPAALGFSVEDNAPGATSAEQKFVGLWGDRSLHSLDSPLHLSDENTVNSGDNDGWIRLSSADDPYIRTGGALRLNDAGTNLLRSVNARYEVYVGDGTNSYGDFSGVNALTLARNFLSAQGVTRCKIVMKPGAYTETAVVDFTGFTDVSIEGMFPAGAGTATVLTFNHGGFGVRITAQANSFSLKNVKCVHTSVNQPALDIMATNVELRGVTYDSHVRFFDATSFEMSKCIGTTTATRSVWLSYTDASAPSGAYGYVDIVIQDCRLSCGQNTPIVRFSDFTTVKQIRFRDVLLQRCVMTTGNVSVSGQIILASEGIGVIGLEPLRNAFDGAAPKGLYFQAITMKSMDVITGTIGTSGTYGPAGIFLTPTGTLGTATWNYTSDPSCALNTVNVEDVNVYLAPGLVSQMRTNLVCIAGVGLPPYLSPFEGHEVSGNLRVKGLFVDVGSTKHGETATCQLPFFGRWDTPTGNLSDCVSGLIALAGWNLKLEDIVTNGTIAACITPTLFLCSYRRLSLDGYVEEPLSTGDPVGSPSNRMTVREVYDSRIEIKNVWMDGNFDTDNWWFNQCILIESTENRNAFRTFSNFHLVGFRFDPSGTDFTSMILLANASFSNAFSTGKVGGWTFENGYLGMAGTGLPTCYEGIRSGSLGFPGNTGNLTFRNVTMDAFHTNGLTLYTGDQTKPLTVERCTITNCGVFSTPSCGLWIRASKGTNASVLPGAIYVRDNVIARNNTASGGFYVNHQANIRDTNGTFGSQNVVYVYGNQCNDGAGWYAAINITRTSSTNLPTSASASNLSVHGFETGYSGQTGSFPTNGNGRIWSAFVKTFHNECLMQSDTTVTN